MCGSRRVHETLVTIPLIGRQRQVDLIRAWVCELANGHGRAALVEGEPGIGKSSLMRVAAAAADAAGCRVVRTSCDELSRAFPLLPLLDAVGGRGNASRETAEIVQMLRADVGRGNRVDVVAAAVERLLALLDDLCMAKPVLLLVDDLQWADPATVQTLGRLARSVRQRPMLVIGTTR